MKSKKGASEFMITTVIVVLLVVVVAAGTLYFYGRGNNKVSDFFSNLWGSDNVDTVKLGCDSACNAASPTEYSNAWCAQERIVKFNADIDGKKKLESITLTCTKWAANDFTVNGTENAAAKIALNGKLTPCVTSCA